MEPKLIEWGPTLLAGFSFYGDPFAESAGWTEENEIGRLWQRYFDYLAAQGQQQLDQVVNQQVAYEVHVETAETAAKGFREVFVGLEVADVQTVPPELVVKVLPAATYAVFTLNGQQIASDWSMMLQDWMQRAGYESAGDYGIQRYDERFKGVDNLDNSVLDVYIPVRPSDHVPTDGD